MLNCSVGREGLQRLNGGAMIPRNHQQELKDGFFRLYRQRFSLIVNSFTLFHFKDSCIFNIKPLHLYVVQKCNKKRIIYDMRFPNMLDRQSSCILPENLFGTSEHYKFYQYYFCCILTSFLQYFGTVFLKHLIINILYLLLYIYIFSLKTCKLILGFLGSKTIISCYPLVVTYIQCKIRKLAIQWAFPGSHRFSNCNHNLCDSYVHKLK